MLCGHFITCLHTCTRGGGGGGDDGGIGGGGRGDDDDDDNHTHCEQDCNGTKNQFYSCHTTTLMHFCITLFVFYV